MPCNAPDEKTVQLYSHVQLGPYTRQAAFVSGQHGIKDFEISSEDVIRTEQLRVLMVTK